MLTSMDTDGERNGYAMDITRRIADIVPVPVIASGGAGCREHFKQVLTDGHADAALAATLFHDRILPIPELKAYLCSEGVPMRRMENVI